MNAYKSFSRYAVYLSPWLGVLLLIAIDLIAHNILLPAELNPGKGPTSFGGLGLDALRADRDTPPAGLSHYAAAVSWIATAKLHFIVCLGSLTAACVRLANFFERQPKEERRKRLLGICMMMLIPMGVFIPFIWLQGNTDMYQLVLQVTAKPGSTGGSVDSSYTWALPFIDGLGILVTACLAAVASQLTYPIVKSGTTLAEKTMQLAVKMQMLRFLLYVGMVVLVTNIVQVSFFLEQIHSFLRSGPDEGVNALMKALVAARSVLGTLLLAAIYLPASFFLKEEAYRLAHEAKPDGSFPELEAWLKERDLVSSVPEMLPRFAALLAPLVAGPLANLATHINLG